MTEVKKSGGIAKDTLDFIREVCKSTHPREFIGLLCADGDLITDVILLPGTRSSDEQAIMRVDMLPTGLRSVGSIHSHPSSDAMRPSAQDLRMFSKRGAYHIIMFFPYGEHDWRCYNSHGEERELEVVERELEHVEGGEEGVW